MLSERNPGERARMTDVAARAGVSKSTVFRALNHRAGVDPRVKERVLAAARELGYAIERNRRHTEGAVGIVMPANPFYFWHEALRGMEARERPEHPLIVGLYATTHSEADALACLESVVDQGARLLIVTPTVQPAVARRLAQLPIPIVYFNEVADPPALFYAGTDFAADGLRLARACAGCLRTHPRLLQISSSPLPMVCRRDGAFRREAERLTPGLRWVGDVSVEPFTAALLPSQLARHLHEGYGDAFDAVYVSQGHLPQVCLALHKLGLEDRVRVIGFENPRQTAAYGRSGLICALIQQDPFAQGAACLEAAYRWLDRGELPAGGLVYAPSKLLRFEDGEEEI